MLSDRPYWRSNSWLFLSFSLKKKKRRPTKIGFKWKLITTAYIYYLPVWFSGFIWFRLRVHFMHDWPFYLRHKALTSLILEHGTETEIEKNEWEIKFVCFEAMLNFWWVLIFYFMKFICKWVVRYPFYVACDHFKLYGDKSRRFFFLPTCLKSKSGCIRYIFELQMHREVADNSIHTYKTQTERKIEMKSLGTKK